MFITIIWLIFPVSSLIVISFLLLHTRLNRGQLNYITFLISLTFGVVAYTQNGFGGALFETDIVRYYDYYYRISQYSLIDFLEIQFISSPNLFFDFINFLLTRVSPNNAQVFSLFWITLIYFFSSRSLLKLLDLHVLSTNYKIKIILLLFGIFSLLSYSYILDLVKQSASIVLYFYSLVIKIERRKKQSYFWLIVSILTHSSTIIMLPIFFLIGGKNKKVISIITVIFYGFFYFLSNSYLGSIILEIFNSQYTTAISEIMLRYDDIKMLTGWQSVHIFQYLILIFIFSFQYLSFKKLIAIGFHNLKNKDLLIISFFSFLILLSTTNNTHTFLRFLNTYSLFFIIPLLVNLFNQKNSIPILRKPLILGYMLYMTFFSWFYFNLRVVDSARSYGITLLNDNLLELFVTSVFGFLNHSIS